MCADEKKQAAPTMSQAEYQKNGTVFCGSERISAGKVKWNDVYKFAFYETYDDDGEPMPIPPDANPSGA